LRLVEHQISGGSHGIGRAIAAGFADEGGQVVIADLAPPDFFAGDPQVAGITGDIAQPGFAAQVLDTAVSRFGKADVLVNDAAAYPDGTLLEMPAAAWERVFAVNVTGTLAGTSRSAAITIQAQPAIVIVQKAEYVVKKGQLTVQATSTNIGAIGSVAIPALQVFNATTGASIGFIRLANVGKGNVGSFTGVLTVTGALTSIGVQDFAGGLAIATVAQK